MIPRLRFAPPASPSHQQGGLGMTSSENPIPYSLFPIHIFP